jgi:hypothetical protein
MDDIVRYARTCPRKNATVGERGGSIVKATRLEAAHMPRPGVESAFA